MLTRLFNSLPEGFIAFVCVGAIGFLVDASVVMFLIRVVGLDPYTARWVSFGVPIYVTWMLNRHWTFRHQTSSNKTREYSAYFIVQTLGLVINFSVYSVAIYSSELLLHYTLVPLAMGSAAAMVFNFTASRRFAFKSDKADPPRVEDTG